MLLWLKTVATEMCECTWSFMFFPFLCFEVKYLSNMNTHSNTEVLKVWHEEKKKKELHWWYSSASPSAYTLLHSVIPIKSQWNRDEMCISSRVGKSAAVVEQQKQLKVHIWYKSLLPCNTEICFLLHLFAVLANVQNV